MQLKVKEPMVKSEGFMSAATSMQWSPDSKKLSVLRYDRNIVFYNENCQRWDQVSTRGFDHTKPSKDYVPNCHSYAQDSQYIAVGQSDNVVYIFNIGKALEKKAIQGRFALHAPATSICWMQNAETPIQCDILVGCQDGTAYICNLARKQAQILFSYQCLAQLVQQKQVPPDGQQSTQGYPLNAIHRINATQAVFVSESGVSALFDLQQPNLIKMVSRHQQTITTSSLMFPRNNPQKQFLVICDSQQKVVVNSVETGQALTSIAMRSQGFYTAAAQNPSGNGVLLAGQSGLQYIQLQSITPFVVQHDIASSLELQQLKDDPITSITSMAWRPDSSVINICWSNGQIDEIVPSLSAFTYCGVEITNVAPNKSQLRLKNFNSKQNNFQPGILELSLQNSAEVLKIKAFPKMVFQESARSGDWSKSLYICAFGERSICVYSFETDCLSEINIQMQPADKLYFDVGVKRVLVQANMQLGEFTVVYLPQNLQQQAIQFTPVRQCSYAAQALISCSPQLNGQFQRLLVGHLGEDRQEFVLTELSPPEEADDFTEPISILSRVKHTRIIDWIDISPTGKYVLIRDVSGAIMIFVIETQTMIDLSPTLGNGMVQWASPFDVIVAQEQPDMPVLVYYNPGDQEDKPSLLNVPNDSQGWALINVDSSQVQTTGQRTSAALYAVIQRHDQTKSVNMPLDQDLLLFNMLMQTKEVTGACILLTKSNCTNKNQWMRLCQLALEQHQFMVCSRCYAALGDLGLSKYSREIHQKMKQKRQEFESDFQFQTYCDAQIALLKGDLDNYDRLLQQTGNVREALAIYRELHLHHRAENIAPEGEKEQLHQESIDWLVQTKQSTLAAQLKAQRGDFRGALELLMNDKAYLSAYELTVKILQVNKDALSQHVVEALSTALENAHHFLQAGNLVKIPPITDSLRALSLYRRGGNFNEAILLARSSQQNECVFIEKEWADQLYSTGHFDQAVSHYIEARETRKAVDCALKAGNYDAAERLLTETTVDNQLELCLRLAEARYLSGETDSAVEWFKRSDQALLAVAALTSVGRFEDCIKFIVKNFPANNAPDVVMQEARRLIRIEERKQFVQPVSSTFTISAANIIQKMESMSSVHGVLAARDLLSAAGMNDQAVEILVAYKMWDDLVSFARDHKTGNYCDVLEKVAGIKREKGDQRGCAQLLSELALELFRLTGGKEASTQLKRALSEATRIYGDLGMFDESLQLCRRCNNTEALVSVALQWIQAQPNQFQSVTQQLVKMQKLDPTIVKAVSLRMFDVAMQLADHAPNPDECKKDIWYRQGMIFEQEQKLQEAEHAYMTAGRPQEALHMYIDNKKWVDAEKVVNNMPMGDNKEKAIKLIKEGRAKALVLEGKFKEAEQLYVEMDQVETMVNHYQERQMWQEALRMGKQYDRRDLIMSIQDKFADQKTGAKMGPQDSLKPSAKADTTGQSFAEAQMIRMRAQQQEITQTAVGLRSQLIQACKAGGDVYLEYLLKRSYDLAVLVLSKKITDDKISEDIGVMAPLVNFTEQSTEEKAVTIAVLYLTKGIPQNLINEKDNSKSTISPIISQNANKENLVAVIKAVLSLEYTEEDYAKRVLVSEITKDGIYSKARQVLLAYRAALMSTQKGVQAYQTNKALSIPGDAELSRAFDAIHLLVQSAYTNQQPNTPQQLKEKCQVFSSILRYCDLIPVDRCLAMAGLTCKNFFKVLQNETSQQAQSLKKIYGGQAFVFLNRFMDVIELAPNQSTGELDAVDIKNSGIPWDVKAPSKQYLNAKSIEDVRSFVMNMSVQNSDTDQELPREQCPHGCGNERWTGSVACAKCKNTSPICSVTGQHVINAHLKTIPSQPACTVCGCYARPAPWNAFVQKTKSCPVCGELGNPMGK
ncbi:Intraflagellar_transport protein 172 [Hexamita inflata]|uniref:Intraflagellar transport protein 172 n=1 Tax=Hexamita inflata TaxID=28002 RepID=A0AA86Q4N8_9EUKA|nr:Intraflagellar transport protein 172 [Hexamita inflata]CAI9952066.1 Intraflagellar transport protein 172 [Hexamita inflata]